MGKTKKQRAHQRKQEMRNALTARAGKRGSRPTQAAVGASGNSFDMASPDQEFVDARESHEDFKENRSLPSPIAESDEVLMTPTTRMLAQPIKYKTPPAAGAAPSATIPIIGGAFRWFANKIYDFSGGAEESAALKSQVTGLKEQIRRLEVEKQAAEAAAAEAATEAAAAATTAAVAAAAAAAAAAASEAESASSDNDSSLHAAPVGGPPPPPPPPPPVHEFKPLEIKRGKRRHTRTEEPAKNDLLMDIAKLATTVKLKKNAGERSPGGTPKKARHTRSSGAGLTPMLGRALRKKFDSARRTPSPGARRSSRAFSQSTVSSRSPLSPVTQPAAVMTRSRLHSVGKSPLWRRSQTPSAHASPSCPHTPSDPSNTSFNVRASPARAGTATGNEERIWIP